MSEQEKPRSCKARNFGARVFSTSRRSHRGKEIILGPPETLEELQVSLVPLLGDAVEHTQSLDPRRRCHNWILDKMVWDPWLMTAFDLTRWVMSEQEKPRSCKARNFGARVFSTSRRSQRGFADMTFFTWVLSKP
ncbi:hypothetical protein MUK42_36161 [Musa troglodytarum]|uniref:Uncharacterized protein n=1 Tax=Musa troglodytarum TaxID=320322 RepID=A0A9E7K190_9LILI|nr:hypothetical protein MUK42_36161 [Musa troglodytarum]